MNNPIVYLLEELENWDDNKPILVKDLKRMILKSLHTREIHEKTIEDSLDELDHF